MTHYTKTVTLPHGDTEAPDHIRCDLCGATTQSEWADPNDPYDATWTQVAWQDNKCVLREYDICPACFEKKLMPWVEGARNGGGMAMTNSVWLCDDCFAQLRDCDPEVYTDIPMGVPCDYCKINKGTWHLCNKSNVFLKTMHVSEIYVESLVPL